MRAKIGITGAKSGRYETLLFSCLLQIILLILVFPGNAQTLSNQVINAAGTHQQHASLQLTDNVGEPFTESLGAVAQMMITQGFLQPQISNGITIFKNDPTCSSRNDGYISVSFSSLNRQHEEQYLWSPSNLCPNNDCGSKVENLAPGTYSLSVVTTYTTGEGLVKRDTLRAAPVEILPSAEQCRLTVYTGVTLNNDGINDKWMIEYIEEYPGNKVSLYNRWGILLFETTGYNNESNYWPRPEATGDLVSGTYFYIIDLADGSRPLKGWVELLKN